MTTRRKRIHEMEPSAGTKFSTQPILDTCEFYGRDKSRPYGADFVAISVK